VDGRGVPLSIIVTGAHRHDASLGVLLAVVNVGVLIYFIHHVSVSIQANQIVARVGKELIAGLDRLFPEHIGQGAPQIPKEPPDDNFLDKFEREARPICFKGDGYIQFIDADALIDLAIEADVVIRLERRPGQYVVAGCPLVLVWPGNRDIDELSGEVNSAFAWGNQRAPGQDVEFAVNQLVEVAVRALFPGVNDPFTAITCVDRLGSALSRLATRDWPSPYRHDKQETLRVIACIATFSDITDAAFNQIRQYGQSSAAVMIRLLETIAVIAGFAKRPEDRAALLRHAEMIVRGARNSLSEAEDRQVVEERFQITIQLCGNSGKQGP
jgi:uncharacterized membrane protein